MTRQKAQRNSLYSFLVVVRLLVSSHWAASTFLDIIPSSYPWLSRYCPCLGGSMAAEIVHDLVTHSREYLKQQINHISIKFIGKGRIWRKTNFEGYLNVSQDLCSLLQGVAPVQLTISKDLDFPAEAKQCIQSQILNTSQKTLLFQSSDQAIMPSLSQVTCQSRSTSILSFGITLICN